ncbi:hypothetical protein OIU78_003682 [Salix suchowensis]|nr:hypothetical protein OIU78_003682 [Salix suchowensis]
MLELSPTTLFSTFGWSLEEPISHEKNYSLRDYEAPGPFTHFPPSPPPNIRELDRSTSFTAYSGSGDPDMVKKLHHNASERDRRKKINSLYSSLRSLLPASDHMKKLSIPSTISRVLKYIPELQQQVERQIQRKEELLSKLSGQASRLGDTEVVVQISTSKILKTPLSEILLNLEENGLVLINSSSFESFGGNVFYHLHLQVMQGDCPLECETLNEKLISLCTKRETFFL